VLVSSCRELGTDKQVISCSTSCMRVCSLSTRDSYRAVPPSRELASYPRYCVVLYKGDDIYGIVESYYQAVTANIIMATLRTSASSGYLKRGAGFFLSGEELLDRVCLAGEISIYYIRCGGSLPQ